MVFAVNGQVAGKFRFESIFRILQGTRSFLFKIILQIRNCNVGKNVQTHIGEWRYSF